MRNCCNDCLDRSSILERTYPGVETTVRKYIYAVLLSLSVAAMSACGPSNQSDVSLAAIAKAAARQDDRVSVEELAGWLIEGRGDFQLIDVRRPEDFDSGRIGDAMSVPIAQIADADVLSELPTDRMLLVYSNGAENAAKAAVLLRLEGFDAHLLAGGYNAWHQRILNPDISAEELDGESLQVSRQRAYACYFVGERSGESAQRRPQQEFVPPVFSEDEEEPPPLPPVGEESC